MPFVIGQLAQAEHAAVGSGELSGEFGQGGEGPHCWFVCGEPGQERGWEGGVYGGGKEEGRVKEEADWNAVMKSCRHIHESRVTH